MSYGERLIPAFFDLPDPGLSIHYQKTEPDHFDSLIARRVTTFAVWGAGRIAVGDWLRVTSDVRKKQRHMATFKIEKVVKTHRGARRSDSMADLHDTATVVEISAPF